MSTQLKQGLSLLLSIGYCDLIQGIFLKLAVAQVTPDSTTSTTVDVSGNDFTINQGDRAGNNLFHSFSDFSVPTDGSAFFNNAVDIVNIFSRVTGGNISNIDGLLGANGSANLFLLNPAGTIFGEGARLDIGGSFLGSTADSLIFPDGEFSAIDTQTRLSLSINAPIGLNLRDNPAEIVNRANLIKEERFGDEQIPLIFPNFNTNIPFEEKIVNTLVGLEVNRQQNITLVGGDIIINGIDTVVFDGVRGENTKRGGTNFSTNINYAIGILLEKEELNRESEFVFIPEFDFVINGEGRAGNIEINTQKLDITNGARITSVNYGRGELGNIIINAEEQVNLRNTGSSIFNTIFIGESNAGNIEINTGSLSLTDWAVISENIFRGEGDLGI